MRALKFYGASDDLAEVEGTKGNEPDEVGAYKDGAIFRVANEHGGLFVRLEYAPSGIAGCWCVGVMQLDEDVPLPDWPMKWSSKGYSVVLEIEAPDSAVVTHEDDQ